MSEKTKISWCDSTINFWEGCTKVSDGCKNCYAEARDKRFTGGKLWGKGASRRKSKSAVRDALAYNRKPWISDTTGEAFKNEEDAAHITGTYHRRRIFSLSLGDWLDDEVPIEWLAEMLDTIRQCDQVTWILCTKRPENFRDRLAQVHARQHRQDSDFSIWICWWLNGHAPSNIILLTSVENQKQADKRIPELLRIPAACRGLSLEPLLGEVNLREHSPFNVVHGMTIPQNAHKVFGGIDWLIIGCESGPNRRFQDGYEAAARSLIKQGLAAGVPVFHKQMPILGKVGHDTSVWLDDLRAQNWPKGFYFYNEKNITSRH